MLKKVANKIAFIIFVLLTSSFMLVSFLSYKKTNSVMIEMSGSSKEAITRSAEIFFENYTKSSIVSIEKLVNYLQKNPELVHNK